MFTIIIVTVILTIIVMAFFEPIMNFLILIAILLLGLVGSGLGITAMYYGLKWMTNA